VLKSTFHSNRNPFSLQSKETIMKDMKRRDFLGVLGVGATGVAMGKMVTGAEASESKGPANETPSKKHRTFVSGREDGRFVQTAGFLQAYMKNLRPKLAFDPKMKAEEIPAWREAVREKLRELMCFPEGFPEQPQPKKIWSEKRDGYRLERWEAYPEPFSVVPFLMLIPDGVSSQSPAPAVTCFPGSTSSKESLAGEPKLDTGKPSTRRHFVTNRQAMFFVKKGFVSVAVENPATGELASPLRGRGTMATCALWMGRNYLGISVFQKACILEWLSKQPFVDSNRIATSGHSLGSNPADILGILYPDLVKAVIHNDFVCNWHERAIVGNCMPPGPHHTVPGLFQWFDHTDLEAALTPCPLLFTEGGRTGEIDRIRQAYKLLGAEDKIEVYYYAKYATPDKRPFDGKEMPEGVSNEEYFQYANVDPSNHRYRPERAVPWLRKIFGV
jgi:Abhydrolase family